MKFCHHHKKPTNENKITCSETDIFGIELLRSKSNSLTKLNPFAFAFAFPFSNILN